MNTMLARQSKSAPLPMLPVLRLLLLLLLLLGCGKEALAQPIGDTPANNTTKGLWGRVGPIPDNAHPRLFWTQAEIDKYRTQLIINHSPAWLWDRYTASYQGVLAVVPDPNNPDLYEPWRTNTRAAITYMLEPTQAKADAIRTSLLAFPVVWPAGGATGDWYLTQGWGFSGFPTSLMYDLLMAYHPATLSANEKATMLAWFKVSAGYLGFADHETDATANVAVTTHEGKTEGGYANWYSNYLWNHFGQAIISGDQPSIDYWADSAWPHDRLTYDGTNPPPTGTNRFDLAMFVRSFFPSGANNDSYNREGFDYAHDLHSWLTACAPCATDPTFKGDGGSYHWFLGNGVLGAAIMAYHNGMKWIYQGFPGQQILGQYVLGANTRTHTDYRTTSLTGHPDIYTYPSNYMAMRVFSTNPTLQASQQYWQDSATNASTMVDPLSWPFLGYPFGVAAADGTYYVSPNGFNGNSCAAAQNATTPKRTFQDVSPTELGVLGCLAAGDKLIVLNGTYDQWIEDRIPSGTAGAPTVIQAESKGGAILRPTTLPPTGSLLRIGADTAGGKNFITVDGLVLDGSMVPHGSLLRGVAVAASGATTPGTGSHDLVLTNLDIHHIPNNNGACSAGQQSSGFQSTGSDYALQFTRSHVHDIGYDVASAAALCSVCLAHAAGTTTLDSLEVDHCQGAAVHPVVTTSGIGSGTILSNTFFHDTGGPVEVCGAQGTQVWNNILNNIGRFGVAPQTGTLLVGGTCAGQASSGTLVYNNTIVHGTGSCIQVGPAGNHTLQNNLCWQNTSDAITVLSGSTGNTIDHNLVTGSGSGGGSPTACSPTNWTKITNSAPLPADFCAYTYLPFRARMPANPQVIDQANTTILQQQYAPNSGSDYPPGTGISVMGTIGRAPTNSNEGNSGYPVYIASSSDPLVHLITDNTAALAPDYGAGDSDGNYIGYPPNGTLPDIHIPAWARPSSQFGGGDFNQEIIQPNGDSAVIYHCFVTRDWVNGDNVQRSGGNCSGLHGFAYGNIVTSKGINSGQINGGDNFAALPVHYNEVINGQINHAMLALGGCYTGFVYPGRGAGLCNNPPGIPGGSHIWLNLTRAQIDATSTTVIPAHMRVFAYAAHEYGFYVMDTGNGEKWFGQPWLEEGLAYLLRPGAPATSFWGNWFLAPGVDGWLADDANYKTAKTIDWRALASNIFVVGECYARGTCSDSIPEGGAAPALAAVAPAAIDPNPPEPLYGDPLFVITPPVAATDFQLRPGPPPSPGIDHGRAITLSGFSTDYGGQARQQGAAQDVGAWESSGTPLPGTGPLAWWKFDEGTGTTTADSSGHGHDLTLSAGVTWGTAKIGSSALRCQGNTGRGTTPALTGLTAYTWAAWLQSPAAPVQGSTFSVAFVNGTYETGTDQFAFSWDHADPAVVQSAFHRDSSGSYIPVQVPGPRLTPNLWYHLALTFETPANTLRLYVNGQPSTVVSNVQVLGPSGGTFYVCGNSSGSGGQSWTGLIDELKVWPRALTAGEIANEFGLAGGHKQVRRHVAAQ